MTKFFYFMHNNNEIAELECDVESGQITQIGDIYNFELLPLGCQQSPQYLSKWWNMRAVPKTRKGVIAALNIYNLPDTNSLLLKNLGLSLTDHYWIKPLESELTWEQVNLFQNEFTDTLGAFTFSNNEDDIIDVRGQTIFIPSASLQGELAKKWVINNDGERCLIKGNCGISCQQSLNEILATEIHKKQNKFPYTTYHLTKLSAENEDHFGCMCSNFASIDLEFIPAIEIANSAKKSNDISEFQFFIQTCKKNGLSAEYVSQFLQYQIESDFCMTNTDRHFNNFGVLRDTHTLKFVDMAPIYDSGNSMFWNMTKVPENFKYLDISVSLFRKKEHQMLEYVSDRDLFDLNKLPSADYIRSLYETDDLMSQKRLDSILHAFEIKKDLLDLFQRGCDLGRLSYESCKIPINDFISQENEKLDNIEIEQESV